jgi:archaeosine-15-forming tRNA-guanine transglycosylase
VEAYEKLGENDPQLLVRSPLGPIPYDILESYPAAQSIFSSPDGLDPELSDNMNSLEGEFKERFIKSCTEWDGLEPLGIGNEEVDQSAKHINRISRSMDIQFPHDGSRIFEIVFPRPSSISFKRSRKTGRIRNVFEGSGDRKKHMLSMRAEDGHLNLKAVSAQRIHESTEPPFMRVIVDSETAVYNAQGYNVFCKFVKDVDRSIRPGDEVIVTDEEDVFQAVGVAALSWRMMLEGSSGIAVKVREGTKDRVD